MLFTSPSKTVSTVASPSLVPKHVAVIMDGNGRWAKSKGWPRSRGHLEGAKAVRECVEGCLELGVEYLTLYAFSMDNWQRPKEEVNTLMGLLKRFLKEYTRYMQKRGIQLQAIGRLWELPQDCQAQLEDTIRDTARNTQLTMILAINYSGRAEITDAVKRVVADVESGRLQKESLDPEIFQRYLYTSNWPDPDLLIRTSGEMRVSDFLLWQVRYTEFYSLQKFWPDFTREDLRHALADYAKRQRRFGGT
jgi:undecaprenyl diphosphate synthase